MFQKNICIRSMKVGNVVLMPLTVVLLFFMFYHLRAFKKSRVSYSSRRGFIGRTKH